jgi:orotidine-5'-phosphate decarboxylase
VVTPFDAARDGATYLVLGRAVTSATDPRAAMQRVWDDVARATRERNAGASR